MSSPSKPPKVYITTWCRSEELLYGSTLVFDSLRTGFPDSDVVVVENASPRALRPPIEEAAARTGCAFFQLEEEESHWSLIESYVLGAEGPIVVVDPDVVFWERIDGWDFGGALMAGRLLPDFADAYSRTFTLSRLHTSHLRFPNPQALRARIGAILKARFEAGSLFEPKMLPPGWWRWDTAAPLYHALGEEAVAFTEAQLDGYDHLFCGSHLPLVLPSMDPASGALMSDAHARAKTDAASLKGIWRPQRDYFASRPWSGAVTAA